MIPQDSFVIVAKVKPGCIDALENAAEDDDLSGRPGIADPANALVPFGNLRRSTSPASSCSRTTHWTIAAPIRTASRRADLPLLHGGLRRRCG